MLHPDVPRRCAAPMRGWRASRYRASAPARRHRVELMPVHYRVGDAPSRRTRAEQLLGLQHARILRPRAAPGACPATPGRRPRVQGDGRRAARCGIAVFLDVVYNHTAEGSQPARPVACAASTTGLLPPADEPRFTSTSPDRQHGQRRSSADAAARLRQPALLGLGDADRRLSLRPRLGAGAPASDVDRRRVLRRRHAGPGARRRAADRRAMGHRRRRLRRGQFPGRLVGMERRYRDSVRRFWRGDQQLLGELATRLDGSSDLYGADAAGPAPPSISSPRMTDSRSPTSSATRQAQRGQLQVKRDGTDDNASCNCGVEGPTDDPADPRAARAPEAQPDADWCSARACR